MYILKLKDPASFLIQQIFSIYPGLNLRPSAPEADDIQMCHRASLNNKNDVTQRGGRLVFHDYRS